MACLPCMASIAVTATPGALAGLTTEHGRLIDPDIVVNGEIDVRDLMDMAAMPGLRSLNLAGASISEYSSMTPLHMEKSHFEANTLPQYIFFNSDIESITLPATLTGILDGAFAASGIREIVIPEGVTELGNYAFYGAASLRSVTLPRYFANLGKGAFENCASLQSVNLGATGVVAIPERCFAGTSALRSLDTSRIREVQSRAFEGSAVEFLHLPQAKILADFALANMDGLQGVTLNPQANLHQGLLMNATGLTEITGLPEIVPDLFATNCISLATGDMLSGAREIGRYAFAHTAADTCLLGRRLTRIDAGTFRNCMNLQLIDVTALGDRVPETAPDTFEGMETMQIGLEVAENMDGVWRDHPVWGCFNIVSSSSTVTELVADDNHAGINISIRGDLLSIRSDMQITEGAVYDLNGRLVWSLAGATDNPDISLLSLPQGVMLVRVKDAGGKTRQLKFIN